MLSGMELATERLLLREFVLDDFEAVHRYAADPEVTRFTDWGPNDHQATLMFLNEVRASAASDPRSRYALAVVRPDLGELIGSIELQVGNDGHGMLGYVLARRSWGNGYATEAASALLRYGFEELGLQQISATCDPNNAASAAVLERIGMRQQAYLPRYVAKGDEWHDRLLFTVDRESPR
jgi:[ribosomal protein S5]-alanine N-acetyltransferase